MYTSYLIQLRLIKSRAPHFARHKSLAQVQVCHESVIKHFCATLGKERLAFTYVPASLHCCGIQGKSKLFRLSSSSIGVLGGHRKCREASRWYFRAEGRQTMNKTMGGEPGSRAGPSICASSKPCFWAAWGSLWLLRSVPTKSVEQIQVDPLGLLLHYPA